MNSQHSTENGVFWNQPTLLITFLLKVSSQCVLIVPSLLSRPGRVGKCTDGAYLKCNSSVEVIKSEPGPLGSKRSVWDPRWGMRIPYVQKV